MTVNAQRLHETGFFKMIDIQFADTVVRIGGEQDPLVHLAAALAARVTDEGHVCVELHRLAEQPIETAEGDAIGDLCWPEMEPWYAALRRSPLVSDGETCTPLVLDSQGRLYLRKLWRYQEQLAEALGHLARAGRFTVIAGGPGTGKTTEAVKRLLEIAERAVGAGASPPRIAALAPTGKAAARLEEVLGQMMDKRNDTAVAALPKSAGTIHRALYRSSGSSRGHRTLHRDVVLVDEASMVDLRLMHRLVFSLETDARLILVGDRDQLASVASGAVLADICEAAGVEGSPLYGTVTVLTRAHRFGEESGIQRLAEAVNQGDSKAALECLCDKELGDVEFVSTEDKSRVEQRLTEIVVESIAPIYAKSDVAEKLDGFRRCRLLAAHRKGALGQEGLNRFVETLLFRRGVIDPRDPWYDGRPILVTENDYQTGLFNGDQGLVQKSEHGTAAVFEEPGKGTRRISTSRLPSVDTVFCMTVHKSQGSEFDTVALFLPEHRSPVVTRELLYTACTRARKRLVLFGTEQVFKEAVETRIHRASGLGDALGRQEQTD